MLTPVRKQYLNIKKQYPGAILFFRMGDFYETFDQDAELISKEPLGVLVRHGDDQWKDVVSWTLKVMILAEELNINSKNIDSFLLSEDNEILRLLGEIGSYGDMIELDEKWAYNIIKQIGNYEEVFDRNLGKNSSLNLKRGLNKLYNEGGLLYAPPFR